MKFKVYLTLKGAKELETPLVNPTTKIPILLEADNAIDALSKIWAELFDKFRTKKDSFGFVTITGLRIERYDDEREGK